MTAPYRTTLSRGLPLAALLVLASPAWAASAQDQAAAEALFKEAKQLATQGNYAAACPKFVESQRLDPTAGTLLNIGQCYEKLGKTASSWGAYKEAEMVARGAGDTEREQGAARLAAALEPLLPKLVVVVPQGARVPGLEVKRDGTVVGEGQWGSPLPVDPGEHTIEVSAPGRQPLETLARVAAGPGTTTVEIPALAVGSSSFWNAQRSAGLVVATVGIAGVGVAAALGALALSKNSASKLSCDPANPNLCNDKGAALRSDAITFGNASTAAFVVGGVMVAGGIVIFVTAPSAKKPQATGQGGGHPRPPGIEILPGLGGLALRGRF
jgi:serine/threonine-protein kinase